MEDHIRFDHDKPALMLLDQRRLPSVEEYFTCANVNDIVYALKEMVVRGAPAIGVTAAWGCVLAAHEMDFSIRVNGQAELPEAVIANQSVSQAMQGLIRGNMGWEEGLDALLDLVAEARPTAVNLAWAVERMRALWKHGNPGSLTNILTMWKAEASRIQAEDIAINRQMGAYGAELLADGDTVMTHCNAGALATAGFGTALGVIYAAREAGKAIHVIANETRPFLQGARLTAYELKLEGVPVTVACDNSCALLMRRGMVQKVVVGADRIASNGDVANKIGTYGVALSARAHDIPFYVAAPLSTIDLCALSGDDIPIEERPASEVERISDHPIIPEGVPVYNFAFDVTPAELIAGIITEKGVLSPPYELSIPQAFES